MRIKLVTLPIFNSALPETLFREHAAKLNKNWNNTTPPGKMLYAKVEFIWIQNMVLSEVI
jgi:hypothetical protein